MQGPQCAHQEQTALGNNGRVCREDGRKGAWENRGAGAACPCSLPPDPCSLSDPLSWPACLHSDAGHPDSVSCLPHANVTSILERVL